MRRFTLLVIVSAALSLTASTAAAVAPVALVADDGGSAGTTCRWNPWFRLECQGVYCRWVGRFEWYDPYGNPTGVACA